MTFYWKESVNPYDREKKIGLIAEEVAPIFPELISYNEEGLPESIDYDKLTPVLIKAIQDLNFKIENFQPQTSDSESSQSDLFASILYWFSDKVVKTREIITEKLSTDTVYVKEDLVVGSAEQPAGITIYDEDTKEPYCIKMKSGQMVSMPGACGASNTQTTDIQNTNIQIEADT